MCFENGLIHFFIPLLFQGGGKANARKWGG